MRAREASLVLTRQRLGDMCLDQESQEQEKLEAPTPRRSDTFRRVSDPLSAYSLSPGPPRSPPAPQPAPATNAAASGYIVSKSQWVGSPPAQGFRGNWRTWQEVSDDDSMLVWDEVSLPLSAPLLPSPPSGPLPLAGGGGGAAGLLHTEAGDLAVALLALWHTVSVWRPAGAERIPRSSQAAMAAVAYHEMLLDETHASDEAYDACSPVRGCQYA